MRNLGVSMPSVGKTGAGKSWSPQHGQTGTYEWECTFVLMQIANAQQLATKIAYSNACYLA